MIAVELNKNGLRMGLEQLANMVRHLENRERSVIAEAARAEDDLNAFRSLLGFARQLQVEFTGRLRIIEEKEGEKSK